MLALIKQQQINRLCLISLNQQLNLSTVKVKVDGKHLSIDEIPKKPKLDLFDKYCKEKGYSKEQLKSQKKEILKSFEESEKEFKAKNKKLVDDYQRRLKEYNQFFKQTIKLSDVNSLIKFYNKTIVKQTKEPKAKRKLSLYNFYIKNEFNDNTNLKELANRFKNLSSTELENYKRLYENYLKENEN